MFTAFLLVLVAEPLRGYRKIQVAVCAGFGVVSVGGPLEVLYYWHTIEVDLAATAILAYSGADADGHGACIVAPDGNNADKARALRYADFTAYVRSAARSVPTADARRRIDTLRTDVAAADGDGAACICAVWNARTSANTRATVAARGRDLAARDGDGTA